MPRYTVTIDEREFDITIEHHGDRLVTTVDGDERQVVHYPLQDTRSLLIVDGRSHEIDVRSNGAPGEKVVFLKGMEIPIRIEDHALAQMRKAAGITTESGVDKKFRAPMPGLVMDIRVTPGQVVAAGEPMVIVEAMKMENVLKATGPGTIKTIHVATGQSVEKGATLIEFE